jgi:hypothetical protein
MNSSGKEYLNWRQERRISLPLEPDEYMLVPTRDFRRLKKRVLEELPPRHDGIPIAYSSLLGASLATGVAIPSLLAARGLPSWIMPTFIVSAGAFLLLALALILIDHSLKKGRRNTASEIAQEMQSIEASYRSKENAGTITASGSTDTKGTHERPTRESGV